MLKQIQLGNSRFTCSVSTFFSAEFDESSFNGNKIDLLFHRVVDDIAETAGSHRLPPRFAVPAETDIIHFNMTRASLHHRRINQPGNFLHFSRINNNVASLGGRPIST